MPQKQMAAVYGCNPAFRELCLELSGRRPYRSGVTVQQLRALGALEEDLGLVLRTHMAAHNCNFGSRESDTLFWPPQAS